MTPVYDEHLELDDLDLVAPQASDDVVPSFHLGDIEEDEMPIVSSKRSRHRRSRSRRDEPRPAYAEEENLEDYSGDHAERETEREYGPPRDVFADLFPGDEPASQSREKESRPAPREKERLTRGSKTRDRNYERSFESRSEVVEERDELSWETDFEEQPKRESRSTESRRDRETIRDEEDGAYEPTVSRKPGRDRKSRGPAGRSRTVEADPFEERDEQEEQEMMQLHKSIPSWDDAVLPIVEQNIVRHGTRKPDSGGRPRGRK